MKRNRIAEAMSLAALAILFYVAFVTFHLVAFALRKDLLELKWQSEGSYWHSCTVEELDRQQYVRQF